MFSFGAVKKTPTEQVKEWRKKLRGEQRELDRSMRSITKQEKKTQAEIKALAKKGQMGPIKTLAHTLVQVKGAKEKIEVGKAQLGSVMMQLNNNLAMMKVSGCMAQSAAVMAAMNEAVKVPQITATMREMSREMAKAGLIEEMVDDTLESVFDDVDEEEVDGEMAKVLEEIGVDLSAQLADAPTTALPGAAQAAPAEAAAPAAVAAPDPELANMQARLEAL